MFIEGMAALRTKVNSAQRYLSPALLTGIASASLRVEVEEEEKREEGSVMDY